MISLFGQYRLDLSPGESEEANFWLALVPGTTPLPADTSSLTAYFVADYLADYFSESALPDANFSIREDLSNSINFIVNELVENSLKFHFDDSCQITLSLRLCRDEIIFCSTNRLDPATHLEFESHIREISSGDPQELLLDRMEKNVLEDNRNVSGLGLLTIINDFKAILGWRIDFPAPPAPEITLTTMVRLPVKKEFYNMEFKEKDFEVWYEAGASALIFKGSLRLGGTAEYAPLVDLFNQVLALKPGALTLDLRELNFLNSSGINIISRFIITLRQQGNIKTRVLGSSKIPWQGKSLPNFQKLFPNLTLSFEN